MYMALLGKSCLGFETYARFFLAVVGLSYGLVIFRRWLVFLYFRVVER